MSSEDSNPSPPRFDERLYNKVLDNMRQIADQALNRLRQLSDKLPGGVVEQVERLHDDPVSDRRKAARLNDPSLPVIIQAQDLPGNKGSVMKDHCPTGLAVFLPCPAGVGTIMRIRIPPELGRQEWVNVEVKYCRKEGDRWVAGCELLEKGPL